MRDAPGAGPHEPPPKTVGGATIGSRRDGQRIIRLVTVAFSRHRVVSIEADLGDW